MITYNRNTFIELRNHYKELDSNIKDIIDILVVKPCFLNKNIKIVNNKKKIIGENQDQLLVNQ